MLRKKKVSSQIMSTVMCLGCFFIGPHSELSDNFFEYQKKR
ncbi:hypothetical protein F3D3_4685 [Fusibacter sp. 3D3]|nr:hypothetical protein F3D3_4685 [Fusibacter sp. 3D3]